MFTYAVVTVSDTCFKNTAEDKSGPSLIAAVKEYFPDAINTNNAVVPDEKDLITAELQMLCNNKVNLILTTGGTGLSKRDVTPEATREIIEKEIPGITQTMLIRSLEITDMAMLSRAVAGTKQNSLIINLPGSSKGSLECFGFIRSVIPHAVQLIMDQKEEIKIIHNEIGQKSNIKDEPQNEESKVRVDRVAMRNRISPYQMIKFDEAVNIIQRQSVNLDDVEEIGIESSLNRVLATDIISTEPFPPFRASIKDGYAVRAEDGDGERVVKAAMIAGDDPAHSIVKVNEAVRISTGACLPEGADAVVQVEDTELVEADEKGNEVRIMIKIAPSVGQDIREIGSDIPANSIIFYRQETITPAHIGVFGTIRHLKVKVFRRPSIGLLSTGNELCPYDAEKIPSGHIRDSNKLTLMHLLQKYSYTASDYGIVKDDPHLLKRALTTAFRNHDVIITTGGVSMGEFDLMKEVLKTDFNATIHFGRVNMKPGKPTTFATCKYEGSRKLIFALPGNPVSATVTCRLFVIPALLNYECSTKDSLKKFQVRLEQEIRSDIRLEFKRIRLVTSDGDGYPTARDMGNQISSRLNSCAGADALLMVPDHSPDQPNQIFNRFGNQISNNRPNEKIYPKGSLLSAYMLY